MGLPMSDKQIFYIPDWDAAFEVAQSRKLKSVSCRRWVAVPNSFDGSKISELIEVGGAKHYGVFVGVALIASKSPRPGYLFRGEGTDNPHTPATIARKTGFDLADIEAALQTCLDVGLISTLPLRSYCPATAVDGSGASVKKSGPTVQDKTGQDRTKQKSVGDTHGAIGSWADHLRERGRPATATQLTKLVQMERKLGAKAFEAAVSRSIAAGWLTIHPDPDAATSDPTASEAVDSDDLA